MKDNLEVFDYPSMAAPALPSWEAFSSVVDDLQASVPTEKPPVPAPAGPPPEEMHRQELERRYEDGVARGREEGRLAERQVLGTAAKAQEMRFIGEAARLAESFNIQRSRYFEAVEREVVRLALAIAARILRREAQMDPLVLSGAVRVALGQLSASTQVRLRVPPADLDLWKDTIVHLPNLAVKPEVVAGEDMRLGECRLEAELGSVDLGLGSQLAEIERGFFDRTAPDHESSQEDMSE